MSEDSLESNVKSGVLVSVELMSNIKIYVELFAWLLQNMQCLYWMCVNYVIVQTFNKARACKTSLKQQLKYVDWSQSTVKHRLNNTLKYHYFIIYRVHTQYSTSLSKSPTLAKTAINKQWDAEHNLNRLTSSSVPYLYKLTDSSRSELAKTQTSERRLRRTKLKVLNADLQVWEQEPVRTCTNCADEAVETRTERVLNSLAGSRPTDGAR